MAKQLEWTKATLEDVKRALATDMGKVPRDSLVPTSVLGDWDKVQSWLAAVNDIVDARGSGDLLQGVPPFPLGGKELRALQMSVDRIARAQAAASLSAAGLSPARLFENVMNLRGSSFVLILIIGCSLAASLINLFVFQGADERLFIGANIVLALFGIVAWIRHFTHLNKHQALLQKIHPVI